MQEDGIPPDVITYTSLIKACALQGDDGATEIAEGLFLSMQQRTNHFSSYIEPTELTYSRLMQANLACGNIERVWQLFELMRIRSIFPSVYAYRSCMNAATQAKDIERGFLVLSQLRPYVVQQRLGLQYKSLPEFYSEMWCDMVDLLQETKRPGRLSELHDSLIEGLKDELKVLGFAGMLGSTIRIQIQ